MSEQIVVVDYGSGNIHSVMNALSHVLRDDQTVSLSSSPTVIARADRLVLPGVGAFSECKRKLELSHVLPALQSFRETGRAFLGVCVGMQILADEGEEFLPTPGLGWIPGRVRKLATEQKLPHVGWFPIRPNPHFLFEDIPSGERFYFVHSYVLDCQNPTDTAATSDCGETFSAAVIQGSIFGCQFHPEKSDKMGLKLLYNFCRWKP